MDCKLNNIEALLHSLLSKVDILSHKMDRFQDRIFGIEGRVVYFEKQLHRLKLSQSRSDSIIPSQATSKSHHTLHNSERQTYSTPRNRQTVYNPHFMYHKQSLHGNVGPPPPPSRPSVSQKNEPPESIQDSNHADDQNLCRLICSQHFSCLRVNHHHHYNMECQRTTGNQHVII